MVEKKKLLSLFVSLWWALLLRKINTFFFFFAHVFFYFCRRRHFELHAHEEKKLRFHSLSLSLFPLSARALLLFFVSVERSNAFVCRVQKRGPLLLLPLLLPLRRKAKRL